MGDPRDRTILVVDDSPPICLYLRRLLEKKGYKVMTANDGAVGARLAMEGPARPDPAGQGNARACTAST